MDVVDPKVVAHILVPSGSSGDEQQEFEFPKHDDKDDEADDDFTDQVFPDANFRMLPLNLNLLKANAVTVDLPALGDNTPRQYNTNILESQKPSGHESRGDGTVENIEGGQSGIIVAGSSLGIAASGPFWSHATIQCGASEITKMMDMLSQTYQPVHRLAHMDIVWSEILTLGSRNSDRQLKEILQQDASSSRQ
ncbi:hypothetical protein JB92DRAFT_2826104 [Gautieria morchelliformis]|nr:hypothetical protein JB92DRAFT_2826104 [Gautieria morchelliformis]